MNATRQPCGSSPHTRGALAEIDPRQVRFRIIPAYAGSTVTSRVALPTEPDHPRIRGEHGAPRCRAPSLPRIIPAYAGSTPCSTRPTAAAFGSSPHTRGALSSYPTCELPRRIIPAYAGSTRADQEKGDGAGDHPRIRGEHVGARRPGPRPPGSSPHTRGARRQVSSKRTTTEDHPRIRGEHVRARPRQIPQPGSSPHTRGALRRLPPVPQKGRIIPAYAGSTLVAERCVFWLEDHPRIRGEHGRRSDRRTDLGGSSPHTRGAQTVS